MFWTLAGADVFSFKGSKRAKTAWISTRMDVLFSSCTQIMILVLTRLPGVFKSMRCANVGLCCKTAHSTEKS